MKRNLSEVNYVMVGSVYYWKNQLQKEKEFNLRPNSFVVHFSIVNQNLNEIFSDWFSFPSEKELLNFIKYVVLPSGYYSNLFGEKDGCVFIEAESYNNVMQLLENNTYKVDKELISKFNSDYKIIENIIDGEFSMENIKEFCDSYNSNLDYTNTVFSEIEVYENIKQVGFNLIEEYEKEEMLDELEEEMEMSKEQIIELFSTIEDNPFMMRKIKEFLSNIMML